MIGLPTVNSAAELPSLGDDLSAHSTIVKALIDVLYNGQLPPLHFPNILVHLVILANKWGMDAVLAEIREAVIANQDEALRETDLFLIAIHLGDYALAAKLLVQPDMALSCHKRSLDQFPPYQTWDRTRLESVLGQQTDKDTNSIKLYSLATCQYHDFIRLPPRVVWALQRATILWDHEVTDGHVLHFPRKDGRRGLDRQQATAETFEKIMMPDCTCASFGWISTDCRPDLGFAHLNPGLLCL
jgi:hypothetical protein